MSIQIREFTPNDINNTIKIWNSVVNDGIAFPQEDFLSEESGLDFFNLQSFTGVAYDTKNNEIVGLYILHPNNVGRCSHISNASYAVDEKHRGKKIGEKLVLHSIEKAKGLHFKILQFNAVVATNYSALYLYEKLGFTKLGRIPKGFLLKDGTYEDIIVHYINL